MTKTILVPVEPTEEMCNAGYKAAIPIYEDDKCEPNPCDYKAIWSAMLAAAPKPTIPADDREEVARAIYAARVEKLGLDLTYGGACGSDRRIAQACADAAISTLTSLGWKK